MGCELFFLSLPPKLELVLERLQFEIIFPVDESQKRFGVAKAHQMLPFFHFSEASNFLNLSSIIRSSFTL